MIDQDPQERPEPEPDSTTSHLISTTEAGQSSNEITIRDDMSSAENDEPNVDIAAPLDSDPDLTGATLVPVSDLSIERTSSSATGMDLALTLIHDIHCSLLGDAETDRLIHHYTTHVADLLQPIIHAKNVYHNLYLPAVFEAAVIQTSNPSGIKANAQSALYHAVLSSAAFHLWNCNGLDMESYRIGARHRYEATHHLLLALSGVTIGAEYRALMMAMLALVTVGVSRP